MPGNKRERAAVNTAFNKLERAPAGTRHDTMLRAAVTIYNNGNDEADWQRLYAYARGVRGEGEARKMRAYVASTAGAPSLNPPPIPHQPPSTSGNRMPRIYAEPPGWLQLHNGGHWLAHGSPGSMDALASAPTNSPAYDRAKVMSARKWKDEPLAQSQAMQALQGGRAVGIIPASVRVLILDVDNYEWQVAKRLADSLADMLGAPAFCAPTRKGYHIMLPTELMLGNGNFTVGEALGQIRSVDGYVVVHGQAYLDMLNAARAAPMLPADRVLDALRRLFNAPGYEQASRLEGEKAASEGRTTADDSSASTPALQGQYGYSTDEVIALEPEPPALTDSAGAVVLPGEGMVLLSGKTRSYKTFLAIEWAFRLAAKGKRIAFLEAEGFKAMGKRIVAFMDSHQWARGYAGNIRWLDMKAVLQETPFSSQPAAWLAAHFEQAGKPSPDVAVVDTFRTIGEVVNENDNAEVGAALKKLRYLAALVIIVHHTRKDNRIYAGAGAFDTNTDTTYELARLGEEGGAVELICHGHRDYEPAAGKVFEFTQLGSSGYLARVDADERRLELARSAAAARDADIAAALGDDVLDTAELVAALGSSRSTVNRRLAAAVRAGSIVMIAGGQGKSNRYHLPGVEPDEGVHLSTP